MLHRGTAHSATVRTAPASGWQQHDRAPRHKKSDPGFGDVNSICHLCNTFQTLIQAFRHQSRCFHRPCCAHARTRSAEGSRDRLSSADRPCAWCGMHLSDAEGSTLPSMTPGTASPFHAYPLQSQNLSGPLRRPVVPEGVSMTLVSMLFVCSHEERSDKCIRPSSF